MPRRRHKNPCYIDDVQATNEVLTSRAGLNLFARYLRGLELDQHIDRMFAPMRKNPKGAPIRELFKQVLCFLFDGTSKHLAHFDVVAKDSGYAAAIESPLSAMVSSDTVRRFLNAFSWRRTALLRSLLMRLFLWRLRIRNPNVIVLGLDTMVMDNDDAVKREGVKPTYKKVLGFAPLQMTWGRYIVDAIFRHGDTHSNHGQDAIKILRHAVRMIRKHFSPTVPIIVRMDSGFCDQKIFKELEALGVGYVCGGKFQADVKALVDSIPDSACQNHYGKCDEDIWQYAEFADRRQSWDKFRRVVFWRALLQEKRLFLPCCRPGTFVYTNLGMGDAGGGIDQQLRDAGLDVMTCSEAVIQAYHERGTDELVHRSFKDFGFEELPFTRYAPNRALYHIMLIGFFLFEAFKEDVSSPTVPISAFPTTLRRKVVDVAAKIVRHAGRSILKVATFTLEALRFKELWIRALQPPKLSWS